MTHRKYFINDSLPILGAGNFGTAIAISQNFAMKLFYKGTRPADIIREATIQTAARHILRGIPHLKIPRIHRTFTHIASYLNEQYVCGILMDRVPTPAGFDMPVHITLGIADDHPDIDQPWGRDMKRPCAPDNPPRGFHVGAAMMEAIWEDEAAAAVTGRPQSLTVDRIAYIMGLALGRLIIHNIIPLDVEFIYGGDGDIYMLDFGLCESGAMDPWVFFHGRSSQTLGVNYYIPRKGMRGYDSFYKGYANGASK